MFAFLKKQKLKWALMTQTIVAMSIWKSQREFLNIPSGVESESTKFIAQAINSLFAQEIDPEFSDADREVIYSFIKKIESDIDIVKLTMRILIEIKTASDSLGNDVLSDYPRIADVLAEGTVLYPELFYDKDNKIYRNLLEKFADKFSNLDNANMTRKLAKRPL